MIKSDAEIYVLIERILKDAGDDPQTVTDIWDRYPEVRESVRDTNDLSDKLGYMWRRNLLDRWYTAHTHHQAVRVLATPGRKPKKVSSPRASSKQLRPRTSNLWPPLANPT